MRDQFRGNRRVFGFVVRKVGITLDVRRIYEDFGALQVFHCLGLGRPIVVIHLDGLLQRRRCLRVGLLLTGPLGRSVCFSL